MESAGRLRARGATGSSDGATTSASRRVLIIVENLPSPFDRRVWQEATTLHEAGYRGLHHLPDRQGLREAVRGDRRHPHLPPRLPTEGEGASGYRWNTRRPCSGSSCWPGGCCSRRGFDVDPRLQPAGQHLSRSAASSSCSARSSCSTTTTSIRSSTRRSSGAGTSSTELMLAWERLTFRTADVSIATNESYRRIAIERGRHAAGQGVRRAQRPESATA